MVDIRKLTVLFLFVLTSIHADIITNKAKATYKINSQYKTSFSNEVKFTKTKQQREYQLEFFKYSYEAEHYLNITDAYYYKSNSYEGRFDLLTPLILSNGEKLNPTKRLPTIATAIFEKKDPIIIVLRDKRANNLSTKKESVKVTVYNNQNDTEVIKLFETSEDSGEFVGYVNPTTDEQKNSTRDGLIYVFDKAVITIQAKTEYAKSKITRSLIIMPKIKELSQIEENSYKKVWVSHKSANSKMTLGSHNRFDVEVVNLQNSVLDDFSILIKLPKNLKYVKNSLKTDSKDLLLDDSLSSQNILRFKATNLNQESLKFSYIATMSMASSKENIISLWCLKDDKLISNIEKQSLSFKKEFLNDKGFIAGKIIANTKTNLEGVRLYLDNGTYVTTDSEGKFHFEGLANRLHVLQLDQTSLNPNYKQKSCTNEIESLSKFVDLSYSGLKRVNFCIELKNQDEQKPNSKNEPYKFQKKIKKSPKMPTYGAADLNRYKKSRWLWPPKKFNPPIPSIKVAITHKSDEKLKLFVNDDEVSLLNYDTLISSADSKLVITTYRGIDLEHGDNILSAKLYSKSGQLVQTLKRKVHFSTTPVKAEILKEHSYLVADGKNPIIIAVKLYDNYGYPLREDMQGIFKLEAPYVMQNRVDDLKNNPLANKITEDTYNIYADGVAYIKIAPTTKAAEAKLHFNFQDRDQLLSVWIKPKPRDWIVVGFSEGTIGYKKIEKNMQKSNTQNSFYTDGKFSFFAKGKIKGDMLLTLAYDNTKSKDTKLFEKIKPDEYYTIYQDNSTQNYEATSQRKLYLKIEKEQFYALFGDINSDLQINELSRYKRVLNGIKSEYHSDKFSYKAFISDSKNIFAKDEIRADGTSGVYRLKHKDILAYSETVYVEIRDRLREEIVLSKTPMRRFLDYSIDFDDGTLYFKSPLFTTDSNANPRYIVVDYEIKSDGVSNLLYGGRTAIKFQKQKIETGITYIKEDLGVDQKNLKGVDIKIKLSDNLRLNAEYAKTDHFIKNKNVNGNAYLFETFYHSNIFKATGYFRNQNDAFGLEQENQVLRHSQKTGIDARLDYFKRVAILMSAYSDKNLLNNTQKDDVEINTEYKNGTFTTSLGYRHTLSDEQKDRRLLANIQNRFLQNRATIKTSYEYSLDRSNRSQIEARYALNSFVDLFFLNEIYSDEYKIIHNSVGLQSILWKGAQINSSLTNSYQNDQQNLFSKFGFTQTYQLNKMLTLSGGIEQRYKFSSKIDDDTQEDFTSYTTAINFNNNPWNSNLQAQFRDAKSEKKLLLDLGIYNQLSTDLGLAYGVRYNLAKKTDKTTKKLNTNFTSAYRPRKRWIILNRLDLTDESNFQKDSSKLVNNLMLNYKPKENFELSLHYGLKYLKEQLDKESFKTTIDFLNINTLYQINTKYDIGVHVGSLYNYTNKQASYTYGTQLGYKIEKNSWLGIGYNIKGFKEEDFYSQNQTNQGPYIRIRVKFDQDNLKDIVTKMGY